MSPTPTPPVAVLGQGSIGRRHAGLLRELGCEVQVYDPSPDAPEVDGVQRCQSASEALDGAEAVVVASPTSEHVRDVQAAFAAGIDVLVEKPLATSAEEARRLLDTPRAGDPVLAVAMNLRFHPGPRRVRQIVAGGTIGTPLSAHFTFGSYLPAWRPGSDYRHSYSAQRRLGGGVLLDVIHEVDYASWVLGRVAAVSAEVAHVSDLEVDVEDVASLVFRFASGAVASMDLDYLDRSYRRGCRVVGSQGTVEWDWSREEVVVYDADGAGTSERAASDVAPTYRDQLTAFLAATGNRGNGPSELVTAAEALHALQVVDAARESSAAGHRVQVTAP